MLVLRGCKHLLILEISLVVNPKVHTPKGSYSMKHPQNTLVQGGLLGGGFKHSLFSP